MTDIWLGPRCSDIGAPDTGQPGCGDHRMTAQDKPWVLLQKEAKPWRFATRDKAMALFNSRRFNSPVLIANAALFGPSGEAWYCPGSRYGQWVRDDERRKREKLGETVPAL